MLCGRDRPITYDDTTTPPDVAVQIDRHNGIWVCHCKDDCPPE